MKKVRDLMTYRTLEDFKGLEWEEILRNTNMERVADDIHFLVLFIFFYD